MYMTLYVYLCFVSEFVSSSHPACLQVCPDGGELPAAVGQGDPASQATHRPSPSHLLTFSPLYTLTPSHTTRSPSSHITHYTLTHYHAHHKVTPTLLHVFTDSVPQLKEDESWASGSEEGDITDGPHTNLSLGGLHSGRGGLNLREAMAQAKIPPIENRTDEVKGRSSPIMEPHPIVGVATCDREEVEDLELSDWDDEEEEEEEEDVKPRPSLYPLGSTHIPSVVGASREPSALQHKKLDGSEGVEVGGHEGVEVGGSEGVEVGGSEGVEVGGSEGVEVGILTIEEDDTITTPAATVERSKVTGGMTMEFEDESSESESDLPMFGDCPSAKKIPRPTLPRLPPINQGPPPLRRRCTSSPLSTSPTLVSPLTRTTGIYM